MPDYVKEITGCLVDVETGDYLDFQYNPNQIADEKATAYAAIRIPGMSHPRHQYVASERRKIAFKVEFWKGDVKGRVDSLRSLLYPEHARTMLKNAPHRVLLFFGDLFPGLLCIVCEVKACYSHLFDRDTLLPQHAEVELVLQEYVDESVNFSEVRR